MMLHISINRLSICPFILNDNYKMLTPCFKTLHRSIWDLIYIFIKIQRTVLEVVPTYWKRGLTVKTETVCTRYTSVQGWRSGCIVTWRRTGEDGPWVFALLLFVQNFWILWKIFLFLISIDNKNLHIRFFCS